jgi:hypothetical protein
LIKKLLRDLFKRAPDHLALESLLKETPAHAMFLAVTL